MTPRLSRPLLRLAAATSVALLLAAPTLSGEGGGRTRIRVGDPVLARELIQSGAGRQVGDYGAFQIIEVDEAAAKALAGSEQVDILRRPAIHLNARTIDTQAGEPAEKTATAALAGPRLRLVQFAGPVRPDWHRALVRSGLRVVAYVPDHAYLVYGEPAGAAAARKELDAAGCAPWEGDYTADMKIHPAARDAAGAEYVAIQMVDDADANRATVGQIEGAAVEPLKKKRRSLGYLNVIAKMPADRLTEIAGQPDVVSIQPYRVPQLHDERQDQIVAGNIAGNGPSGPGYLAWLVGKGFSQTQFTASAFAVDVTDSGIDNGTTLPNHFGLYVSGLRPGTSRVAYNRLEGTPNAGSTIQGCDGHGTINTHIIGGYNDIGGGFPHRDTNGYRYGLGVCPFVRVGSSVIFDPGNYTWPDYSDLQSRAYRDGARISGNSWGADSAGAYTVDDQEYDALVRDAQPAGSAEEQPGNQEMVICFSAGNAGPGGTTIGDPGSAKNVICVGATENVHPFGGSDGCGYGDVQADNLNDMADFSSRGPCQDGRKKPDIVAPGIHITGGVFQEAAPGKNGSADGCFDATGVCAGPSGSQFWPLGQEWFTTSDGTSHSQPAVAGAAALTRQYFLNRFTNAPSAAMTKGFLMNAARYLSGSDTGDDLWSNNQGMGGLDIGTAFDGAARLLRDQDAGDTFTASGQQRVFGGRVCETSKPVRVTLAWTDAPGNTAGNAFNNDLDLVVKIGGRTYRGNVFSGAFSTTGGSADERNNVESVFLPAGETGQVVVIVTAANVNSDGVPGDANPLDQDFALIAYNVEAAAGGQPIVMLDGWSVAGEDCGPTNGVIDPYESVGVAFAFRNVGDRDTSNLVVTLLETNNVLSPGPAQTYGVVTAGTAVARTFTFVAGADCEEVISPTFRIEDDGEVLGEEIVAIRLGLAVTNVPEFANGEAVTFPGGGAVEGDPWPSTIHVSGIEGTVIKVVARLNGVTHSAPDDIDVALLNPLGAQIWLISDAGGSVGVTNLDLVFDDAATNAQPDGGTLVSGSYPCGNWDDAGNFTPQYLSAYNGVNPNGDWGLYASDDSGDGDAGGITGGWSLTFYVTRTECCGPDLALSKEVAPASVRPGEGATYTIVVTNSSDNPASGIEVTDALDAAALAFVSAAPSQGSYDTNTGLWAVGSLAARASASLEIAVTVRTNAAGTSVANTAAIAAMDQVDANPDDNTAGAGLVVLRPVVSFDNTSFSAENCGSGNGVLNWDETVTVELAIRNTGTANASNVIVTVLATNGIIAPSGPQTYGLLQAGGAAVARPFSFTAPSTGSTLTVRAQIRDGLTELGYLDVLYLLGGQTITTLVAQTNGTAISIPEGGSATPYPSEIEVSGVPGTVSKVRVQLLGVTHTWLADVDVLLVGPDGQMVMLMSDVGDDSSGSSVSGLDFTFDDSAAGVLPSANPVTSGTYRPTDVSPGDSLPAPAPSAPYGTLLAVFNGTNANGTWSLYAADDTSPDGGTIAAWAMEITTVTNVPDCGSDVSVTKSVGETLPPPGSTNTYTITVTNRNLGIASLVVTDALPAAVSYLSHSATHGTYADSNRLWTVGPLAKDEVARLDLTVLVRTNASGLVTNRAMSVVSVPADRYRSNNTGIVVMAVGGMNLAISKSSGDPAPAELEAVTFTVVVTNEGPGTATGVQVTDLLPATLVFSNYTASQGAYVSGSGLWTVGTVSNGQSATLSVVAGVAAGTSGTVITNRAAITASTPADPEAADNSASATLAPRAPVVESAGFVVAAESCSPTNGAVDPAELVTVSFALANTGSADASNVTATLLATNGVVSPSGVQSYGLLAAGGGAASQAFSFTADGACGGAVEAVFEIRDGTRLLGVVSVEIPLGLRDGMAAGFANGAEIVINDAAAATPYPSTITVAGTTGGIERITVTLSNLVHNYPDDIDVLIVAPGGEKIILLSDAGGTTAAQGITVAFDSDAVVGVPDAGPLTSGVYRAVDFESGDVFAGAPAAPYVTNLGVLAGTEANGEWSLYVVDDYGVDGGVISNGWSLYLETASYVCEGGGDLAIGKVVDSPVASPGQGVVFTITVTNSGPNAMTGIVVTDSPPAGISITNGTAGQGVFAGNVWTVGDLPAGTGAVLVVEAVVSTNVSAYQLTNTASLAGVDQADGIESNNTARAVVTVPVPAVSAADWLLTAEDCGTGNGRVDPGEQVTVSFGVRNTGSGATSNLVGVLLSSNNIVPIVATQVYGVVAAGGASSNSFTFLFAGPCSDAVTARLRLEDGSNAMGTLTFALVAADTGTNTVTNGVAISIRDSSSGLPYPSTITITNYPAAVDRVAVILSRVSHTYPDDIDILLVGPDGRKVMLMSDAGGGTDINNLNFVFDDTAGSTLADSTGLSSGTYRPTDFLPGESLPSPAPGSPYGTSLSVFSGCMPTGTWSLYVSDDTGGDAGSIAGGWGLRFHGATRSCCGSDLGVAKTVSDSVSGEGQSLVFTVTVSNNGPQAATGVQITDVLPTNLLYGGSLASQGAYATNTGIWSVGTLGNASTAWLELTAAIRVGTAGSAITNRARITALGQSDEVSANDQASAVVLVRHADIGVSKTADDVTPGEGQTVVYTIRVTNSGPHIATGLEVTDLLPAGMEYLSSTNSRGSYRTNDGGWAIGILTNGRSDWLEIRAAVASGTRGLAFTNTASVTALEGYDPASANDSSSAVVTVQSADAGIVNEVDEPWPDEEGPCTFFLFATNSGPDIVTGLQIVNVLPAGVTLLSSNLTAGAYDSLLGTWFIDSLAPGSNAMLHLNVQVDGGTAGFTLTNRSFIAGADQADPDAGDNAASVSIAVQAADAAVSKSVDNPAPAEGNTVVFTVVVTNGGPSEAPEVQVSEAVTSGFTIVSSNVTVGSYDTAAGIWSVGPLAAGTSEVLTVTASVDAGTLNKRLTNTASVAVIGRGDPVSGNNTSAVVIAVGGTDVEVRKTVDAAAPNEGQSVTFTVVATNAGPNAASGLQIADALPAGLSISASNATAGVYDGVGGLWDIGGLAAGTSAVLTVTAVVDTGTQGLSLTNRAVVTALTQADLDASDDSASVSIRVRSADVRVAKTVDDATPGEGQWVTYTVTVTNAGPDAVTGLAITDLLPPGVTLASSNVSAGVYNSASGLWSLGVLAAQTQEVLRLDVTVDAGMTGWAVTNRAAITACDTADPAAGNNAASVVIDVQAADLSVAKTVDNATPGEWQEIEFTITASNAGPDTATGVVVEDVLPAGLTYIWSTNTAGSYSDASGLWTIGSIAPSATAVLGLRAYVDLGWVGAVITNTASVAQADQADAVAANNSAGAVLSVEQADVAVRKTVDDASPTVGDSIAYTVVVSNEGPSAVQGLVVSDRLPGGLAVLSTNVTQGSYDAGAGLWTVGALAPAAAAVLTIDAEVLAGTAGQRLTNMAAVSASVPYDPVNQNNASCAVIYVESADLSVTKTADDPQPSAGDVIVYRIVVSNSGPDAATGIAVTDAVPAGVTMTSWTAGQGAYTDSVWAVGAVPAGGSAWLEISAGVDAGSGGLAITNRAAVLSADVFDPVPANGAASAVIRVVGTDLAVSKTVNNAAPRVGDLVIYRIDVTNNGPDAAVGVVIGDVFPSGLTPVFTNTTQGSYTTAGGSWSVGALAAGASASLNVLATVNSNAAGWAITNTAAITAADPGDPVPGNDIGFVVVAVNPDTDGDGAPDSWESANSFDPSYAGDALIDTDEDGYPNLEEYIADTNPRDDESYLRILSILDRSTLILTFPASTARVYDVHCSAGILPAQWQTLYTKVRGTNAIMSLPDTNRAQNLFYRVNVEVP